MDIFNNLFHKNEEETEIDMTQGKKYPVINFKECVFCRKCIEACKYGVYDYFSAHNEVKILDKYNCVTGCTKCADRCHRDAIEYAEIN